METHLGLKIEFLSEIEMHFIFLKITLSFQAEREENAKTVLINGIVFLVVAVFMFRFGRKPLYIV